MGWTASSMGTSIWMTGFSMAEARTYARDGSFLACQNIGFIISPHKVPGYACNGCSHYSKAMQMPEWVMSVNCPCLDCLSKRVLLLEAEDGALYTMSDQLEHWTDGPVGDFAEGEWFNPARITGSSKPVHSQDGSTRPGAGVQAGS